MREVTPEDIETFLETLPAGHRRRGSLLALRAAFRVLRVERVTFADPVARVRPGRNPTKLPTPAHREIGSSDLEALNSAEKLMALLVLVHAARRAEPPRSPWSTSTSSVGDFGSGGAKSRSTRSPSLACPPGLRSDDGAIRSPPTRICS
ncbi:MAG: hypothetical protein M3N32_04625 [Actinomycetota bacterium]|nr:hypothetical protein [Actinomycetota bacterium]